MDETLHELMDGVDLAEVRKMGVYEEFVSMGKRVVKELGMDEGEAALVVNGRVCSLLLYLKGYVLVLIIGEKSSSARLIAMSSASRISRSWKRMRWLGELDRFRMLWDR